MLTVFSTERQQQWRIDFKMLYLCQNITLCRDLERLYSTCVPLYPVHVHGQLSMDFELTEVIRASFLTKIVFSINLSEKT